VTVEAITVLFGGLVTEPLRTALLAFALAFGAASAGMADPAMDAVMKELVPTGKLRVAIAVAPAPSALYAIKDGDTGRYRGVTVDLGSAMAKKLGVPVEFLPHLASGEIQNSAAGGKWDVTFMPVDEERKKFVDFGNAYHLLQSTYLVAPGSKLLKVEDANEAGVRIGGVANTATFRAAQRTAPKAAFVTVPGVDAAVAAMKAGEIDCIALSRESLSGLAAKILGSRVLDGGFLNSSTAVAVPKGKPDALAYVSQFVEDAKATGIVRKAFDAMDLKNSQVAPAGLKP
jgi:polar amino acid transport system substrate-binding protein